MINSSCQLPVNNGPLNITKFFLIGQSNGIPVYVSMSLAKWLKIPISAEIHNVWFIAKKLGFKTVFAKYGYLGKRFSGKSKIKADYIIRDAKELLKIS